MQLQQNQKLEQKTIITQSMVQSLHILQMSLPELDEFIREQALSNPLIDLDTLCPLRMENASQIERITLDTSEISFEEALNQRQDFSPTERENEIFDTLAPSGLSLAEDLHDQIASMSYLERAEPDLRPLCDYLIDCLNDSGYLDCDITELAEECNTSVFRMEQALFVLQSLDPPGVAARSLQECLILQLARSKHFNAHTVGLIRKGLPLLAKNDISGIAKVLNCNKATAQKAANIIRNLSPRPARGYGKSNSVAYTIPEACIKPNSGRITIEMNHSILPQLHPNEKVIAMLKESGNPEDLQYLKQQQTQLSQLSLSISNRCSTLERILQIITYHQSAFFLNNAPVIPLTMRNLAKELDLNTSTISRAIQGKTIEFEGKIFLLRDFFSTGSSNTGTENILQRTLMNFIRSEDPNSPLSDEKLRIALEETGISISRRAVAMHREKLGIPRASQRKKT